MAAPGGATWTVAELCAHLTRLLATAFPDDLWLEGQIRNLSRAASGHVYFDLTEPPPPSSSAALGAAVGSTASITVALLAPEKRLVNDLLKRSGGSVRMEDGIEVRIGGRVRWWAPRGQVQFRMSSIDPAWTLGRLAQDRERVLASLAAEGLLERNGRQPWPLVPLRVGLVTSDRTAAHADFLAELQASGFGFAVRFVDARMQGFDCERSVLAALRTLAGTGSGADVTSEVDVVALVRGGGARTDLAAFDSETIARAIAAMPVPVLTGIGHEIDASIADSVAHRSFKTPTAVAAALVDRVLRYGSQVDALWEAASRAAGRRLDQADGDLRTEGRRIARATRSTLDGQVRACDEASRRLARAAERALVNAEQALAAAGARCRSHDPAVVLARGWSITRTAEGRVVRRPGDVASGDPLVTTVADGEVHSRVSPPGGGS